MSEEWARADDDGDGIPNAKDACPSVPGPARPQYNETGCPYLGIIVDHVPFEITTRIAFDRMAAHFKPVSLPLLHDIAATLRVHPEISVLEIEGHASSDEPAPRALGEARAKSVFAWLVANGVDPKQLVVITPAARTDEERASDRAVSFHVRTSP
jgi:outer membrane protein OmpA-like peptidoglycan-associated protein